MFNQIFIRFLNLLFVICGSLTPKNVIIEKIYSATLQKIETPRNKLVLDTLDNKTQKNTVNQPDNISEKTETPQADLILDNQNEQENKTSNLDPKLINSNITPEIKQIDLISIIQDIVINSRKDISPIQIAIEQGADVNAPNEYGNIPIMQAIRFGRLDIVQLLLQNEAEIDIIDSFGDKPLKLAARNGYENIVEELTKPKTYTKCKTESTATQKSRSKPKPIVIQKTQLNMIQE